ncbi:Inhibitor of growth protein 5 [Physocladia obscura]|uniref:Inhibitor of growth protein 5 n=1 Tax=Physocladia obscura TaxID=109957 RepID=A0AAD5SYR4_9FUNG|nr:Inhibitor of growth protein 5 [Physocladia obscura]
MRELGGMANEVETTIEEETRGFVPALTNLSPSDRTQKISALTALFREYLKHGEDKVALAVQTYDMVDRHIRRLDEDLAKYEDEQMTGPRSHQQMWTPHISEMIAASSNSQEATAAAAAAAAAAGTKRSGISADSNTPKKLKPNSKSVGKPSTPQPESSTIGVTGNGVSSSNVAAGGGSAAGLKKDGKKFPSNTGSNGGHSNFVSVSTTIKRSTNSNNKSGVDPQPFPGGKGSPDDLPIDPNEPRYCICNGVSWGDMIVRD